jgi:cysteinyl-tRNA synthetase
VRFFILQSHYRNPVDFSDDALAEARVAMDRIYSTLKAIKDTLALGNDFSKEDLAQLPIAERNLADRVMTLPKTFVEAMDDDFGTPKALGQVFEAVRAVNAYLGEKTFSVTSQACFALDIAWKTIREVGLVLGLFLEDPDDYFRKDRDREAAKRHLDVAEIERLIEERWMARKTKNWKRADEIRDILSQQNIVLNDASSGTTWKIA